MTQQRNAWLDSLRALAVLIVIATHTNTAFWEKAGIPEATWYNTIGLGGHGVDLFFVLSGWLLGGVIIKEIHRTGTLDTMKFWRRRWWRTLPAYFAILALSLLQRVLNGSWQWSDSVFAIFIQNYWYDPIPFYSVSWSLCVEEHFYIIIAASLFFVGNRKNLITALLLTLIVFPCLFRAYGWYGSIHDTHVRLDACASGVLLAHMMLNYPAIWKNWMRTLPLHVPLALAVVCIAIYKRYTGNSNIPPYYWVYVSAILVSLCEANSFFRNTATSSLTRFIAIRSYAMYLVHVEAIAVIRRLGISNYWLYVILVYLLTMVIAEALHQLVELPGLRYRDSLEKRDKKPPKGDLPTPALAPNS